MGLDNGIVLKAKEDISVPSELMLTKYDVCGRFNSDDIGEPLDIIPKDELVEICYWRKCWGIRNEIVYCLGKYNLGAEYAYKIPFDTIDEVCDIINKFTKEYYYNMYARSIWDWDEMVDKLKLQITRLEWCKRLLKEDKIELEFYDSY